MSILNLDEIKFNYFSENKDIFNWITNNDPFINDLFKIEKNDDDNNDDFVDYSQITGLSTNQIIFDNFYNKLYEEINDKKIIYHKNDQSTVSDGNEYVSYENIVDSDLLADIDQNQISVTGKIIKKTNNLIDIINIKKLYFNNDTNILELNQAYINIEDNDIIDFLHSSTINSFIVNDNEIFNKINNICYLYQIYAKIYNSINKDDFNYINSISSSIELYTYTGNTINNITINTNPCDDFTVEIKKLTSECNLFKCHIDFLKNIINTNTKTDIKKKIFLYYNIIKILFQVYIIDLFNNFKINFIYLINNNKASGAYTDTYFINTEINKFIIYKEEIIKNQFKTEFNNTIIQYLKSKLIINNKELLLFIYGIKPVEGPPIFTKKDNCIFETASNDILNYVKDDTITKNKFVVIDTNTKNIYNLKNNILITNDNSKYLIDLTNHPDICKLNRIKIISKNSYAEKINYNNKNEKLLLENNEYLNNIDYLDEKKSKYESLKDNYKYINLFYYLTFIIIVFILISLLNQSDTNKIILYLIILIIIYSLFTVYTETKDYFSDDNSSNISLLNDEINKYVNTLFLIADSKIELYYLYKKLSNKTQKELKFKILQNKYINNNIINEEDNINSSWINYYRKILFIHTLFLMVFVIIIFHLLNSIFNGITYILLLISIIAFMIILFLYFSKINSIVRTNSKHKYWSNMKI
jgi:hypothetical protein